MNSQVDGCERTEDADDAFSRTRADSEILDSDMCVDSRRGCHIGVPTLQIIFKLHNKQ